MAAVGAVEAEETGGEVAAAEEVADEVKTVGRGGRGQTNKQQQSWEK